MTSDHGGTSALAKALARKKADAEQQEWANRVLVERQKIWRELLVEPVDRFVPRWAEAWERFGHDLSSGTHPEAAASIARIGDLIVELQGIWSAWSGAAQAWLRDQAGPWNERYGVDRQGAFFLPHPFEEETGRAGQHWHLCWASIPGGPATIPGKLVSRFLKHAELNRGSDERHLAVYLLGGLVVTVEEGHVVAAAQADIEPLLAELPDRELLSRIVLVLAALVLPEPSLLDRFYAGEPADDAVRLASRILATSGDYGEQLSREFQSRREARTRQASDSTPTTPSVALSEPKAAPPAPTGNHPGSSHPGTISRAQPTIWHHGGQSYSIDRTRQLRVSDALHAVLQAFLRNPYKMNTEEIEKKAEATSGTVARVITELEKDFGPAIDRPHGRSKGGYLIRVRPLEIPKT